MKRIYKATILFSLLGNLVFSQSISKKVPKFYKGGIDSLEKHIYKNIRPKIESISTDYMPVSYTHLDVYKRQNIFIRCMTSGRIAGSHLQRREGHQGLV